MEVDRRWNRARLSTPKLFVQVIVVAFSGLTESRTDSSEFFQSKSVTQNPQFALFIQNELELRSRRKNLGISLGQPRFRFSFRLFRHLSPFIAAIRSFEPLLGSLRCPIVMPKHTPTRAGPWILVENRHCTDNQVLFGDDSMTMSAPTPG